MVYELIDLIFANHIVNIFALNLFHTSKQVTVVY